MAVSSVSALAIIALPVEVYLYGSVFAWTVIALLSSTVIATVWYIPLYHKLKVKSVFEVRSLFLAH